MLGVNFGRSIEPDSLVRMAKHAEKLGYDSVWVPETWGRDPFVLLSLIAKETEKIKLATGIVNIFSNTPARLAMSSGTLSEISGRFILGLGASGEKVIKDFHGLDFRNPVERMSETIDIVKLLLGGKKGDYNGRIFRTSGFSLNFSSKMPEIFIAALGPRMLSLAFEKADGILFNMKPIKELETIRKNTKSKMACVLPCGTEEERRATVAFYIGQMGRHYFESVRVGGFENEAEKIRTLWIGGKKEVASKAVSAELLNSVSVSEENIKKFSSIGIPILGFDMKTQKEEDVKKSLERFSEWA